MISGRAIFSYLPSNWKYYQNSNNRPEFHEGRTAAGVRDILYSGVERIDQRKIRLNLRDTFQLFESIPPAKARGHCAREDRGVRARRWVRGRVVAGSKDGNSSVV
jgi:hypothetical protein